MKASVRNEKSERLKITEQVCAVINDIKYNPKSKISDNKIMDNVLQLFAAAFKNFNHFEVVIAFLKSYVYLDEVAGSFTTSPYMNLNHFDKQTTYKDIIVNTHAYFAKANVQLNQRISEFHKKQQAHEAKMNKYKMTNSTLASKLKCIKANKNSVVGFQREKFDLLQVCLTAQFHNIQLKKMNKEIVRDHNEVQFREEKNKYKLDRYERKIKERDKKLLNLRDEISYVKEKRRLLENKLNDLGAKVVLLIDKKKDFLNLLGNTISRFAQLKTEMDLTAEEKGKLKLKNLFASKVHSGTPKAGKNSIFSKKKSVVESIRKSIKNDRSPSKVFFSKKMSVQFKNFSGKVNMFKTNLPKIKIGATQRESLFMNKTFDIRLLASEVEQEKVIDECINYLNTSAIGLDVKNTFYDILCLLSTKSKVLYADMFDLAQATDTAVAG